MGVQASSGMASMSARTLLVLADRDGVAHLQPAAHGDHGVDIEARVGAQRELPRGPGMADAADRLAQEVAGAATAVGTSLAQAGHEHLAAAGRDREERVVAAHAGVAVVEGTLLGETVGLADGRVEVDGERSVAGSRTRVPGSSEQLPADAVELADVAPAEAAQEGAQGRGRLHPEAQDPSRATRAQGVRVVDVVATRERRHHQRQDLVADVGTTGLRRPGRGARPRAA